MIDLVYELGCLGDVLSAFAILIPHIFGSRLQPVGCHQEPVLDGSMELLRHSLPQLFLRIYDSPTRSGKLIVGAAKLSGSQGHPDFQLLIGFLKVFLCFPALVDLLSLEKAK